MGRELKRVARDFKWPLNKTWKGFINHHYEKSRQCPDCENGYSQMGAHLHDLWYGKVTFDPVAYGSELLTKESIRDNIEKKVSRHPEYYFQPGESTDSGIDRECERMLHFWNKQWCHHLNELDVKALVDAGRLWDFTHKPLKNVSKEDSIRIYAYRLWEEAGRPEGDGKEFWVKSEEDHQGHWLPYWNGYMPTPKEVNLWSLFGMGHDSINANVCIRARCEREGHSVACATCGGEARVWSSEKDRAAYENWQKKEPPAGDGYQIWETVSEGSPISPVFANAEGLAFWMFTNHTERLSYDSWLKWINEKGWSPSIVIVGDQAMKGVEFMSQELEKVS